MNASGGINGRMLSLTFFDDYQDASATVANVKSAMEDAPMIGMIGVPSATRGEVIFKALGPEIRANPWARPNVLFVKRICRCKGSGISAALVYIAAAAGRVRSPYVPRGL